jgi:hypothetical protein
MTAPCIVHGYAKDKDGYGRTQLNGNKTSAHRLAYCVANKVTLAAIKGKVIRHTCDNASCINPAHLVIGTVADNVNDSVVRNRINPLKGTEHPYSKLTETQVLEIRSRSREPQWLLAKEFGVNRPAISKILLRTTWKHI